MKQHRISTSGNILLGFLLLLISSDQAVAWFSPSYRGLSLRILTWGKFTTSRTALADKASQFNLEQLISVDDFLKSTTENISGVFALENDVGDVLIVESSDDIRSEIENIFTKYKDNNLNAVSVRVQSFSSPKKDLLDAYKNELIKNTNPIIANYVKLSPSIGVLSPFATSTSKVIEYANFEEKESSDTDLTVENVNRVLDEVRPFLIADGGNIAVVSVDPVTRNIELTLQGACGTCSSSTTTMKMGVERVLKENFPNLGVISAITPLIEVPALTIDAVNETLAKILPAVKGMGGTLSIENVDSNTGTVYIQFAGPERLKKGLEMVLRDSSLVKAVIFQELSI